MGKIPTTSARRFTSLFSRSNGCVLTNVQSSDVHAVVITGVDRDAGTAAFNNPGGDKDQACSLTVLSQKINAYQHVGKTLAFCQQ